MTQDSPSAAAPAPEPRLAATLLLVRDDPFEVLMIRRNARQAFASALVFPGGTVDEADYAPEWLPHLAGHEDLADGERALRIAAIRETFEETAILLAHDAAGGPAQCPADAHRHEDFLALVRRIGGRLHLDRLAHFAHWITPELERRRFDAHFFVAAAPRGATAACDGSEVVGLEWAEPRDVLARSDAGESAILFPTRLNLQRLAASGNGGDAIAAARASRVVTVLPQMRAVDGGFHVRIPENAGYAETEEWRPAKH